MSRHKKHSSNNTKEHSLTIVTSFIVFSIGVLGALVLFYDKAPFKLRELSTASFSSLHQTYLSKGLTAFLSEKEALKQNIAAIIRSSTSSNEIIEASNIAVFLFPDILPDNNFEKADAAAMWQPHQQAIEKAPHSAQSRQKFEDMRANIYNYESPSRKALHLSTHARQVIRIYDTISAFYSE